MSLSVSLSFLSLYLLLSRSLTACFSLSLSALVSPLSLCLCLSWLCPLFSRTISPSSSNLPCALLNPPTSRPPLSDEKGGCPSLGPQPGCPHLGISACDRWQLVRGSSVISPAASRIIDSLVFFFFLPKIFIFVVCLF